MLPIHTGRAAGAQGVHTSETDEIQRASVEGVTTSHQGAIEQSQMPGAYPPSPTATPFEMSPELRSEAAKFAKKPQVASKEYLSERMQLEGSYLAELQKHAEKTDSPDSAFVSFPQIARDLGLENPVADNIERLQQQTTQELKEILKGAKPDQDRMQALTMQLKKLLSEQTELFAHQAAKYEEVKRMDGLPEEAKINIQRSELSFSAYATKTACDVPNMVAQAHEKASLIERSLKAIGQEDEAKPWTTTTKELEGLQKDISSDFKTAVDQAKLTLLVDEYQKVSGDWKNKGMAFIGQGVRQAGLSGFALGAVRAFTLAGLEGNTTAQVFGAGATTGIAHEVGTQLLAPAILEIVGGATRPINTAEVLPAPNKFVSENGVVRERNEDEMKAAKKEVADLRKEHEQSKNANKTGSLPGEAKAWSFFSGIQGASAAVTNNMDLTSTQQAGAITLGSIIAGFFMGATHGADGLNAKMKDQYGRALPAHTMKKPSDAPLKARLKDTIDAGWAKLNPADTSARKVYENKIAALTVGLGYQRALDPAIKAVENSSPAVKAGVTGFVTGVQSIMLLSQAWGGFGIGAQTAADKKAAAAERKEKNLPEPEQGRFDRLNTARLNVFNPGRDAYTHATKDGVARLAENAYTVLQGIGEIPETAVTDMLEATPSLLEDAGRMIGSGAQTLFRPSREAQANSADGGSAAAEEHEMATLSSKGKTVSSAERGESSGQQGRGESSKQPQR